MAQDLVEQHLEERSMQPDDRSPGFAGALGVFSVRRCIMMYLALSPVPGRIFKNVAV